MIGPRAILEHLHPYIAGTSAPGGIKLSSNENPFGPSPAAVEAISRSLAGAASLNRYPDGTTAELRERLAEFWDIKPDMVAVGNGSDELLVMIAGAFIAPGSNAVTARHTFSQYTFATTIFGGTMRYAEMRDGAFDLDAIIDLMDCDTRLVFLCNPNNPTGTAFAHTSLASFLERVAGRAIVVVDEAYAEFADQNDFPGTIALIGTYPNLVRLRTFSKVYGLAGLRVGYATAQDSLIGHVTKLRQPFNVGTLAQRAAVAALGDGEFVRRSVENNTNGRARIGATLDQLGVPYYPSQANFVCAHFGNRVAPDVARRLEDAGIFVRPLGSFGLPGDLRISVGTPDEVDAVCAALDRALPGGLEDSSERGDARGNARGSARSNA